MQLKMRSPQRNGDDGSGARPLTPKPPGRQVHLPGLLLSDDGLRRWLHEEADTHLERLGSGALDCVDVSHNSLTDEGVNSLVDYFLRIRQPTRRLKLFHNRVRNSPAICDLIRDDACGIGARDGLAELHLSHNCVTSDMLDGLLEAIGHALTACNGRRSQRQPFYLRLELNSSLTDIDAARLEDESWMGFKVCLNAGNAKSGCNLRSCRRGADVHIIFKRGP